MDFDQVMAIGSALLQLPDRDTYRTVRADDVLWIHAADRYGSGCVAVRSEPFAVDEPLDRDLIRYWTRHVTPRWQTAHPFERTPFRVSDIIAPRRWRGHEVFNELKEVMPAHQLTIAPPPPARFRAWVLVRRGRDFTEQLRPPGSMAAVLT